MAIEISVETSVDAPIEKVWSSWNSPEDIKHWNTASDEWHTTNSTVDLRPGGTFSSRMEAKDGSFGFDFSGTYTKVIENELIESRLDDSRSILVEFIQSPNAVIVRETFESEGTHSVDQQRDGWQAILNSFKKYVESKNVSR